MKDLKELCEKVLKDSEEFHRNHKSPMTTAERLAKACLVLSNALDQIGVNSDKNDPRLIGHIQYGLFVTGTTIKALSKADEICRGEG